MSTLHSKRKFGIRVLFVLSALILIGKAFELQVLDDTYAKRARSTAIDKLTIYPSRGLIYDHTGNHLLVNNDLVFDLWVTYNQVVNDMDVEKFCTLLNITHPELKRRLNKDWSDIRYSKRKPFVFLSSLSPETYNRFQESLYEFPGFFVQARNVRGYPDSIGAHVLGFIREVNQREIDRKTYELGDYIGGSGLEKYYEEELRGNKGAQFVLKDNLGRIVDSYDDGALDSAAVAGKDIVTTLNVDLQAYAEKLLQNKVGSVVAINPKTGGILALASTPGYDPNKLSINRNRGAEVKKLSQDSLKPFFNRAIQAQYPPGSTFKTLVALIALQEGVLQPNQAYSCPGYYAYNTVTWGCRNHPHPYDVKTAIQYSCNTYFFHFFRRIIDKESFYKPEQGMDIFSSYLREFGLGSPLNVDLPAEEGGLIPTSDLYNRMYPQNKGGWKSPTVISLGIGQGELQLTTLQMANVVATIANKGSYVTPHLVNQILTPDSVEMITNFQRKQVGIDSIYFEPVIEGMKAVVSSGTGRSANIPGVVVAGKTGTVQNPHGDDHSTFIAFAPVDDPQIALAVYVENAGGGGRFAAPIAGLLLEKYLNGEIHPSRIWWEQRMLEANLVDTP